MYIYDSDTSFARRPCFAQCGFTLVEALIGVLIFIIGVLGVVGLQSKMIKNVSDAKYRADAAYLADQIVSQMWLDLPNLSQYSLSNISVDNAKLDSWKSAIHNTLPGIDGVGRDAQIVIGNNNIVTVVLRWKAGGEQQHNFTMSTQIQAQQ